MLTIVLRCPLLIEDFIVMLFSLELGFNLLSRAKKSKTDLKDTDALLFTKSLVILADSSIFFDRLIKRKAATFGTWKIEERAKIFYSPQLSFMWS